jgi:hypothetical protein
MSRTLVRLQWRDEKGHIERELQVARLCPQCRGGERRRVDTHGNAAASAYAPVECTNCIPGTYYAIPLGALVQMRDVADYRRERQFPQKRPPRSIGRRFADAVRAFVTDWRTP